MEWIPQWAIGVAAILVGAGMVSLLVQVGDAVKRRMLGPGQAEERRAPRTVIGMHLGTAASEVAAAPEVLEDLQRRVAELEERLDFAERLLSRQREAERLGPPPD